MARKIALVTANYYPVTCGVGDYSMRLGSELLRRGHEARIFTQAPAGANPDGPGLPLSAVSGAHPLGRALGLSRALDDWAPDEVWIQYVPQMLRVWRLGSAAIPLLAQSQRRAGRRVVIMAHELYLPWSVRPDMAMGAATMRAYMASLLRSADEIWVTTPSRRRSLERLQRLAGGRARLGIAPIGSNVQPVPAVPVPGTFRVGLFSSLATGKRFDLVLEAFAEVVRAIPNAELRLIGDLGDRTSRRFRGLARGIASHTARARIVRTGKLTLAEVAQEVAALSVYLFPMDRGASTRSGTLPLPLGSGVPVVAVRGEETSDLFRDDENLVVAEALSGAAFAKAIQRVAADAGLRARVVEGGKRLYEGHLRWSRIADVLLHEEPRAG